MTTLYYIVTKDAELATDATCLLSSTMYGSGIRNTNEPQCHGTSTAPSLRPFGYGRYTAVWYVSLLLGITCFKDVDRMIRAIHHAGPEPLPQQDFWPTVVWNLGGLDLFFASTL